jgi:hypothetical protein
MRFGVRPEAVRRFRISHVHAFGDMVSEIHRLKGSSLTARLPSAPPSPVLPPLGTIPVDSRFTDNGRKARYGLAYFRSICAQAGVTIAETEPDEDVAAVDVGIRFPRLTSHVQVKCTSGFKLTGKSLTMSLEPAWVASWKEEFAPVYFLVVVVPKDISGWISHPATSTSHKTGAYWARFDPGLHVDKIKIPKSQRFTLDTLHEWKRDVDNVLGLRGAP